MPARSSSGPFAHGSPSDSHADSQRSPSEPKREKNEQEEREELAGLLDDHAVPSIPTTLLKELVAFSALGTQATVSKAMALTQPTVTRGLRQLEKILGVRLFDRAPNKTTLTPTGRYAADRAQELLAGQRDFVAAIRHLACSGTRLRVGSTLPGPMLWLKKALEDGTLSAHAGQVVIDHDLTPTSDVAARLGGLDHQLMFSEKPIARTGLRSVFLGPERLSAVLNVFSPLAARPSVTFADLSGLTFLAVHEVGAWRSVMESNIPNAHFVYQRDLDSTRLLLNSSTLPGFVSNLSISIPHGSEDHVIVPIRDKTNLINIYGVYPTVLQRRIEPIIAQMRRHWPSGQVTSRGFDEDKNEDKNENDRSRKG